MPTGAGAGGQRPIVGRAREWARDLAIVGGITGAAAPGLVIFEPTFSTIAALVGVAGGLLIGGLGAPILAATRKHVPLTVLLAAAPAVGLVWGGVAGGIAGTIGGGFGGGSVFFGLVLGALAGALQLGWLFPALLFQTVLGGRRWPIVAAACMLAPMLGWVSLVLAVALLTPLNVLLFAVALPLLLWGALALEGQIAAVRERAVAAQPHADEHPAWAEVAWCEERAREGAPAERGAERTRSRQAASG